MTRWAKDNCCSSSIRARSETRSTRANAALQRDRAQARLATLDLDRAQALLARNVISQSEYDQKRAAADAAVAGVASDSASAGAARLALNYASIRAPIPGRTGRLLVHDGDYVKSQSSDALVTINQTRPVRGMTSIIVAALCLAQPLMLASA